MHKTLGVHQLELTLTYHFASEWKTILTYPMSGHGFWMQKDGWSLGQWTCRQSPR